MHAPLAQRSKTEEAEVTARKWAGPRAWLIAIVVAGAALAAYFERGTLYDWLLDRGWPLTYPGFGQY